MAFFENAGEIYNYIGGAFREAANQPAVAAGLATADLVLQIYFTDPDATLTIRMGDPIIVRDGGETPYPDVALWISGDIADRFWRGEYSLAAGLAKGEVRTRGWVSKVLKLVAATKPVFAIYREKIAQKDQLVAGRGAPGAENDSLGAREGRVDADGVSVLVAACPARQGTMIA